MTSRSTDPAFWSATEQARAIRQGDLGSRELLERYIERIERFDPDINAVVTRDFEQARQSADQADRMLARGEPAGPLHGLAVTIKDALQTRGIRSTGGARELKENIPDVDAPVVRAVKDAGAIVMGKTNLPRWSGDIQAFNDIFGTTNNPWNRDRVPGGSSGGAAAAVAAGFTSFEIGTDIGGSIRFPSSFCGVFGHKPSFGIVPGTGYLDHTKGGTTESDINVIGPIARSADDLELLLNILVRHEGPLVANLTPANDPASLRIATWLDDPFCPVDHEVGQVLEGATMALAQAGHSITRNARPDIDPLLASNIGMSLVVMATSQSLPPAVVDSIGQGAPTSTATHRQWLEAHMIRESIRQRWTEFFTSFDILLMPVCFVPPFPHNQAGDFTTRTLQCNGASRPYMDVIRWTILSGMAYLPVTVPPIGLCESGLPIGIQVVGAPGADLQTIAIARRMAELTGGYQVPPSVI